MRVRSVMSLLTASPTALPALSTVSAVRLSPPELASPIDLYTGIVPLERSSYFASSSFQKPPSLNRSIGATRHTGTSSPDVAAAAAAAPVPLRAARTRSDIWEVSDDNLSDEIGAKPAKLQEEDGITGSKGARVAKVKSRAAKAAQSTNATSRRIPKTGLRADGPGAQGTVLAAKITKPRAKKPSYKTRSRSPDEPLGLEMGVMRRMDWTPPKAQTHSVIDLLDSPEEDGQAVENGVRVRQHNSFQGLLVAYNYGTDNQQEKDRPQTTANTYTNQPPPMKRRKLDLIKPTVPTKVLAAVPKKDLGRGKAPKKKARTITALATRDFMPIDNALDADGNASLMDTFLSNQNQNHAEDRESVAAAAPITAGRRKSTVTKTKATPRAKVTRPSRLLAPELAIDAAESQELLFGTSSQLVREDSPSFIRDLQVALKESEVSMSQPTAEEGLLVSRRTSVGGKNLWAAARRGADGELLNAEVVDLSKTPRTSRRTSGLGAKGAGSSVVCLAAPGGFAATPVLLAVSKADPPLVPEFDHDNHMYGSVLGMDQNSPNFQPHHQEPESHPGLIHEDSNTSLPKSIAEAACRTRPRSKSPVKKAARKTKEQTAAADSATPKSKAKSKATTKDKSTESEPKSPGKGTNRAKSKDKSDFNTWTVPELTKKIKSYGFKAVKGKSAMVALLEKCRESQGEREGKKKDLEAEKGKEILDERDELASRHFPVDEADTAAVENTKPKKAAKAKTKKKEQKADDSGNPDDPAPATPKKRGRPRKESVESPMPTDSPTAKSPRTKAGTKPKAKSSSKTKTTSETVPLEAPATDDASLLLSITTAITRFPPTHDPKNLSWHERILMYDPIVLEDLTVWLNTEGLGAVGIDEEVWPSLVRTWCEERSVCCLWRENLRGGKRARY